MTLSLWLAFSGKQHPALKQVVFSHDAREQNPAQVLVSTP